MLTKFVWFSLAVAVSFVAFRSCRRQRCNETRFAWPPVPVKIPFGRHKIVLRVSRPLKSVFPTGITDAPSLPPIVYRGNHAYRSLARPTVMPPPPPNRDSSRRRHYRSGATAVTVTIGPVTRRSAAATTGATSVGVAASAVADWVRSNDAGQWPRTGPDGRHCSRGRGQEDVVGERWRFRGGKRNLGREPVWPMVEETRSGELYTIR